MRPCEHNRAKRCILHLFIFFEMLQCKISSMDMDIYKILFVYWPFINFSQVCKPLFLSGDQETPKKNDFVCACVGMSDQQP